MNLNLPIENDYQMMSEFFQSGGTLENMPEALKRVRLIWLRADKILRDFPYYSNEKIAEQLRSDMAEYDLPLSTAKAHVTYAKKYFDTVEAETPATHKRLLTELCYKQIAKLTKHQKDYPTKAHITSKSIETWANRIASINGLYNETKEIAPAIGDTYILLSSDALKFNDIPDVTEKELYSTIEKVTKVIDVTETEKQKIIDKDVKNNILK